MFAHSLLVGRKRDVLIPMFDPVITNGYVAVSTVPPPPTRVVTSVITPSFSTFNCV